MKKYSILTKFTAHKKDRDQLTSVLLNAAQAMEQINDCHIYTISIDEHELHTVYVYEVWKSEAAHRASLNLEVTQQLVNEAKPLISGIERLFSYHTLGGKGL